MTAYEVKVIRASPPRMGTFKFKDVKGALDAIRDCQKAIEEGDIVHVALDVIHS